MSYVKQSVSFKEFMMHEYIYNLSLASDGLLHVPKINDYDIETQVMTMENIPNMCVSDFYGEKSADISSDLFARVRDVVKYLHKNHIIYPDITGYNFIECEDKLWIIDFEHSDFKTNNKNTFVERFVNDDKYNKWNPDFA